MVFTFLEWSYQVLTGKLHLNYVGNSHVGLVTEEVGLNFSNTHELVLRTKFNCLLRLATRNDRVFENEFQ